MALTKTQSALIFCIAFVTIGYLAPVVFASSAPTGYYVDDVELTAGNTTTTETDHPICLQYDARRDITGMVIQQMVLINEDGEKTKLSHDSYRAYLESGTQAVRCPHNIKGEIEPGTYQYKMSITFTVENGRVERTVTATSNEFVVTENGTTESVECKTG